MSFELTFEWDPEKALENQRKHGVAFEEARTVFGDAFAVYIYDGRHSWEEDRFIMIGQSENDRILVVVYVERTELRMRLVSARRANRRERQSYEEKASR
jgi:uncharacterized DUF497 family protein